MAKFSYEIECSKCSHKKVYDASSREELNNMLRSDGWLIKHKTKKIKFYTCVKHLYDRKVVKRLAIKISLIINRKLKKMKKLEGKDLWDLVPRIYDLKDFKKRDLKKVMKGMNILCRYGMHHPDLMHDINVELELRKKTKNEKEKLRAKAEVLKDKWKPRAIEVLEQLKKSKTDLLPIIKNFSKEVYDKDYLKLSMPDCDKFVVKLLKEIEEENKKKTKKDKTNEQRKSS